MAALTKLHCTVDLMSADDACGCTNSRMLGVKKLLLDSMRFYSSTVIISSLLTSEGQNVNTTCNCQIGFLNDIIHYFFGPSLRRKLGKAWKLRK